MGRYFLSTILALLTMTAIAQNKMRPVDELINTTEPTWNNVKGWIDSAKNKVEILPADNTRAADALYKTQVTTRSPMGAVIFMTGGLLVDDGWIRILGSGDTKLKRNLPDWNKGKAFKEFGEMPSFLLVADDAVGGFYLLNGGGLGKDLGKIYYFSPDNLRYEPLNITYTEFLHFCFNNNLDEFYEGMRWIKWRDEVSELPTDSVVTFYPFLWTKEGKNINENQRKIISVDEQYSFNMSMRQQLGLDK